MSVGKIHRKLEKSQLKIYWKIKKWKFVERKLENVSDTIGYYLCIFMESKK